MDHQPIVRILGSLALIILSTSSTTTDCENYRQATNAGSQVVVEADRSACWKVTVDDRTHTGCGNAKFYASINNQDTEVEKVDGDEITITVIVNGKTVYHEKVNSSGEVVRVNKVKTASRSTGTYTRTNDDKADCDDP